MELERLRESQGPARAGQSWDGDAVRAIFARGKKREFSSHRNAKDHWRAPIILAGKINLSKQLDRGIGLIMGKGSDLLELRLKLDEAITYGTHKEALALAKQGLKRAEENKLASEIEYFKGQIQILKKNFTTAIEHFDAAIKHNPGDGAAYNDRALCMVELGIIDAAFYYFDKGIEAEPDYATVYHNKGWLLNNIGRHKEAIEYFKRALELEPDRAVTYDNLADALFNLCDYKGALEAYRNVLGLLKPGSCLEIRKQVAGQIRSIERYLR